MQKPISTDRPKKDYIHSCLKPVDAYVRGLLADKIKDNDNKPVKPHILANIQDYSIGRRSLALLEAGVILPNHRCRDCNGKGYQIERGEKTGKLDAKLKPEYQWFTRACQCITKTVKPTELKNEAKPEPKPEPDVQTGTDQGSPAKKRAPGKRKPKEDIGTPVPKPTSGSAKRPKKV